MGNTLRVCSRPVFPTSLSTRDSPQFPILSNPAFTPDMGNRNFPTLLQDGLYQTSHFLSTDGWPSITTLISQTGQFKLPFWKALQLHHFLHSLTNPQTFKSSLTTFEDYCLDEGTLPQILSKTYSLLVTPPEPLNLRSCKNGRQTYTIHSRTTKNNLFLYFH